MSIFSRNNSKYLLITTLSVTVILLNGFLIFRKDDYIKPAPSQPAGPIFVDEYYDKDFIDLKISNREKDIHLPNNRNIMLIGLNYNITEYYKLILSYIEKIKLKNFDIDILIITRKKDFEIKNIPVYTFNSKEFDNFFKLRENNNFIMVIDKNNKIKFYLNMIVKYGEFEFLMKRYQMSNL